MTTFDEIKNLSKLPEKSVALCMRGDLQAEHEDLDRQLKAAKDRAKRGATLSGGSSEVQPLEERMAALKDEMRDSTLTFTLRALVKKKWSDLLASKPPREEDKEKGIDYHGEAFPVALVQASLVDPSLTLPEVEKLCDEVLTQGQWDLIFWQALLLNRGTVEVPT